jgi:hypothetical protein
MARRRKSHEPLQEGQVQGLKYFDQLQPLLARLHDVGTERDRAGNRQLHMDEYCLLLLVFLFNPIVDSLRGLQQASQLKQVQKKLGCPRTSLGSLSESVAVFDPARLREVVQELGGQLEPLRQVGGEHVKHLLTAVDGSVLKTLSKIAQAAYLKNRFGETKCGWRLHTHFDIDRHVPKHVDVTSGLNSGKSDEKNVLRANLQPDHCYVMDRWYAQFQLFNDIHAIGSSYVCRLRDNSDLSQLVEDRPLSAAAGQADVLGDRVVQLGSKEGKRTEHPVRVILVKCSPHSERGRRHGGKKGPPSDGVLRIATNLLGVPAEVIADIYHHRWLIETFFRFFKHLLGCRHL